MGRHVRVRTFTYDGRNGTNEVVHVNAGRRTIERVVPPAGEEYAFDRENWATRVEVYVSPTGRSVRVYVNGREVAR